MEGYKNVVDNRSKTGRAPTKFLYFQEMDSLLGLRHDIHFPIMASQNGVQQKKDDKSATQTSEEESAVKTPTSCRKRKRRDDQHSDLLAFLKESEAAANRRPGS